MRSRQTRLRAALVVVGLGAASCRRDDSAPHAPAVAAAPAATQVRTAHQAAPAPAAPTPEAARQALAWLRERLRAPASDPKSPWVLAHGLLAFGKDLPTSDGRNAVQAAASFAESHVVAGRRRYAFPAERDGQPVEPHPHLLVKTFLEVGVDRAREFRSGDGTTITLGRLLDDMVAAIREPSTDADWYSAAWWLAAVEMDVAGRAAKPLPGGLDLPRVRLAALSRLEADDAPLATLGRDGLPDRPALNPFAVEMPMGLAKRNKTNIYGHPCGGLHFVQAVLRSVAASGQGDLVARAGQQVRLLLSRYQAERALYADTLRTHPSATLLVSAQQLKFFGHLLETLALADDLGLLSHDAELAETVSRTRRAVVADLLSVFEALKRAHAYDRLTELSGSQHQLYLDLIGDGCHAAHGLSATLPLLDAR